VSKERGKVNDLFVIEVLCTRGGAEVETSDSGKPTFLGNEKRISGEFWLIVAAVFVEVTWGLPYVLIASSCKPAPGDFGCGMIPVGIVFLITLPVALVIFALALLRARRRVTWTPLIPCMICFPHLIALPVILTIEGPSLLTEMKRLSVQEDERIEYEYTYAARMTDTLLPLIGFLRRYYQEVNCCPAHSLKAPLDTLQRRTSSSWDLTAFAAWCDAVSECKALQWKFRGDILYGPLDEVLIRLHWDSLSLASGTNSVTFTNPVVTFAAENRGKIAAEIDQNIPPRPCRMLANYWEVCRSF
jgi:hypothetical protein